MINSNATKDVNGYDFLNTAKSTKKADSIDAAQDRFMKLLVTQLQTQDPMNPMDNAAMTSQMAQKRIARTASYRQAGGERVSWRAGPVLAN